MRTGPYHYVYLAYLRGVVLRALNEVKFLCRGFRSVVDLAWSSFHQPYLMLLACFY